MKLRLVPASHGVRWIRQGAVAVLRFPLAFASIFATGLFAMMVAGFVPYIGELVLLILLPAGTLVFMVASRLATESQGPLPAAFVEVLRAPRSERAELLKLGVASSLAVLAAMLAAHVLDQGVLWRFVAELAQAQTQSRAALTPAVAVNPQVQLSILLQIALLMLASIPLWHAPGLVHWGGYGWAPSLFFSVVACWRNKAAFIVYGFAWLALSMAFSLVLTAGAALFGPVAATFALVPMVLLGWTLFFTTRYFTFMDCFERSGGAGASSAADQPSNESAAP